MATDTHRAIEAVWRIESSKLIAGLARIVRDVGLAEDFAQDALVAALDQWPRTGIPDNPGAWLTTTAKRRAIDHFRRSDTLGRKVEELAARIETDTDMEIAAHIEDDLLRLIFTACHPVIPQEARIALTLRMLGGLTTAEIARAFLISEPALGQRIVRAKRTLAAARVPFEVPGPDELDERLSSVLEVIYLIFNEGYEATGGDDWMRPSLCEEGLRLGRFLASLAADKAEVHGLVALMELQGSRLRARTRADGEPILLLDQDRGRWDHLLIGRGLESLARAEQLGGGWYTVQAAIAACHARARTAAETDWVRIAGLYDTLARAVPSPIVELNRGVAHAMAFGPAAGLAIVDAVRGDPALHSYHPLPSARGDLLAKLGRNGEARVEFERAASLTSNARVRALLLERVRALE